MLLSMCAAWHIKIIFCESVEMKILLSASACSNEWGSEPGVAWRWAQVLGREHEVIVLTHQYFERHLSRARIEDGTNITFKYLSVPTFGLNESFYLNSRIYYVLWQLRCFLFCLSTGLHRDVDLIHHVTLGTFRFPAFLGLLGKPFVMGPLGGGERAPMRLARDLPWRDSVFEWVRLFGVLMSKVDPGVWINCLTADLILCKTEESKTALPSRFWGKCRVRQEIGVQLPIASKRVDALRSEVSGNDDAERRPLKALFAGRLIGWKGVHLAIGAIASARAQGADVTLTIAGKGSLRDWLEDLARREGVAEHVDFVGHLERDELTALYESHDVFVFPSLHDSSGNVVLESMRAALPIVCLDLGGPRYFVTEETGCVIETSNMSSAEISRAIGEVLVRMDRDRAWLNDKSARAGQKCPEFAWDAQVARAYGDITACVKPLEAARLAD
jgi:glycosyltransferase involved in cell wall biosynthesis